MPTTVTAQDGDTLCTLAINNGFKDCMDLRGLAENANLLTRALVPGDVVTIPDLNVSDNPRATDTQHKFEIKGRQVGIRFVHGSPNLPFDQDLDLPELGVSNFTTTLAGATEQAAFPAASHVTFDANANVDPKAFKVEVIDSRPPGATLEVVVEPIRPTYDSGGTLNGHVDFDGDPHQSGTVRGFRALIGQAHKITAKRFRTGYLRLVADDIDAAARTTQAVLTTDMVQEGDAQVEILDQDIRATYVLKDCPNADPNKCRVEKVVSIGRGQFVDLAVHILRATPSGVIETTPGGPGDNGVVQLNDMQGRINTDCRQHWAQDSVKFKTILKRTLDIPSNMLTVADGTGNVAHGLESAGLFPGQVGFTLRVQRFGAAPDSVFPVSPITINAGDTPEATANRIATAINAVQGLTATVSVNPVEVGNTLGSADILIADSGNGRVTITDLLTLEQDSDQTVSISDVSLNFGMRNALSNYHVGHPHERNLYKSLDTGSDRIDIFVVQSFAGNPNLLGFTICSQTDLDASRQPLDSMRNTIVMRADSADGNQGNVYALPHEIGHALLDCALHADSSRQLMFPTLINVTDVNDPRRLIGIDPPSNNWTNVITLADHSVSTQAMRMNTITRVQAKATGLLHS